MSLLALRAFHRKQRNDDSIDKTLYGIRQSGEGGGRPSRVYSELGGEVRDFLGALVDRFRTPEQGGMGGPSVAKLRRQHNAKFVDVPFARFPPAPEFELLVAEATVLPDIATVDDQRLFDAGVAAEYFISVRQQFRSNTLGSAPVSPPAFVPPVHLASDLSCGLSTLPLAMQNYIILNMMFSLMTPGILVEFEMYETPADILNEISTWELSASRLLHP